MVIAGPTTLAALISSLQLGFKSLAIEQRTQEVMNLLGAIRTDFAGFASLLGRTQKKLKQATEELDHAQQHTQTIAKRLSDVNGLPEKEAKKLLGVMDDIDRALVAMSQTDDIESVRKGIELIHQKLLDTLHAKGVQEIEAIGSELDTDLHEAVAKLPVEDDKKGKIIDVVQKGYKLKDKVVRYAKVVVGE